MTAKTAKATKFTPAMRALLIAAAPINLAKATAFAADFNGMQPEFDYSAKSIAMFCHRNGVPYENKQPTTKSGGKVEKKEDLVAEIGRIVSGNLTGLEKASKEALQSIRDHLVAEDEDAA
jgi:hypothetical protein